MKTIICLLALAASLHALPPPNPQPPGNVLDSRVVEQTDASGNKASLRLQISSTPFTGKDSQGQTISGVKIEAAVADVRLWKKDFLTGKLNEQTSLPRPVQWNITYKPAPPAAKTDPATFPAPTPASGIVTVPPNSANGATIFSRSGSVKPTDFHGSVTLSVNGYPTVNIGF